MEPRWGRVQVADVDADDVEAWLADMQQGTHPTASTRPGALSATMVRRCQQVLAGVLDMAVRARKIPAHPVRAVTNLPVKRASRGQSYLRPEELLRLADAAGDRRTLVLVLGLVGLRWSEAIVLRPRDVDFARSRIAVVRNAVEGEHNGFAVGLPKGYESRAVPIPAALVPLLREAVTAAEARGGRDALLFPPARATDFMTRPDSGSGWLDGAVKRSGVQRVTAHELRHTAASIAVSSGASVLAVARMLGHAPDVTLRIYADLFDDDLDAVADAIGKRMQVAGLPLPQPESDDENGGESGDSAGHTDVPTKCAQSVTGDGERVRVVLTRTPSDMVLYHHCGG